MQVDVLESALLFFTGSNSPGILFDVSIYEKVMFHKSIKKVFFVYLICILVLMIHIEINFHDEVTQFLQKNG